MFCKSFLCSLLQTFLLLLTFTSTSTVHLFLCSVLSPSAVFGWLSLPSLPCTQCFAFCAIRPRTQGQPPGGRINSAVRTMAPSCQLPSASVPPEPGCRGQGRLLFRMEAERQRANHTKIKAYIEMVVFIIVEGSLAVTAVPVLFKAPLVS